MPGAAKWKQCFNEAAANCDGILGGHSARPEHYVRFNEAAANCDGIRGHDLVSVALFGASMKPPQIATEYDECFAEVGSNPDASMKPPQIATEYEQRQALGAALQLASMKPPQIATEYGETDAAITG